MERSYDNWIFLTRFPTYLLSTLIRAQCLEYIITYKDLYYIVYVKMPEPCNKMEMAIKLSGVPHSSIEIYIDEVYNAIYSIISNHNAKWLPLIFGNTIFSIFSDFMTNNKLTKKTYMQMINPTNDIIRIPCVNGDGRNICDGTPPDMCVTKIVMKQQFISSLPSVENFNQLLETERIIFPMPMTQGVPIIYSAKYYTTLKTASDILYASINKDKICKLLPLGQNELIDRICQYSGYHNQLVFMDTYISIKDTYESKLTKLAIAIKYLNIACGFQMATYYITFWQQVFAVVPQSFINLMIPRIYHDGMLIPTKSAIMKIF